MNSNNEIEHLYFKIQAILDTISITEAKGAILVSVNSVILAFTLQSTNSSLAILGFFGMIVSVVAIFIALISIWPRKFQLPCRPEVEELSETLEDIEKIRSKKVWLIKIVIYLTILNIILLFIHITITPFLEEILHIIDRFLSSISN